MTKLPIIDSYWVKENSFLAGEYPGSHNDEQTRRRMDAFIEAGIQTFIDLTQPHELVPYEPIFKEEARIYEIKPAYYRFAIRDHGVPSRETMVNILNTIDSELNQGRGVYVHCWGGVGRTGITVGCYLIRHGLGVEEALKRVHTLFRTRPLNYYTTSPETPEQFEFVRAWQEIPKSGHQSKQNFCEG
ncbi:MAG: hypothetical protein U0Z26_00695 [Anaerolineales bacterium]